MKKADRLAQQRQRRQQNQANREKNIARRVYHRLTAPPPKPVFPRALNSNDMADAVRYSLLSAHYGTAVRAPKFLGTFTSA